MEKKQRIICTVINDLTYDQRMIRICTSLANAGYEVLLVGRKLPKSKPFIAQAFQQKRLNCLFNKGKLFYIEYNIRLFFFLLFARFDIICSIDLDTLLAGFGASRLKRAICVYDAHEYFTETPEVVHRPKVKRVWEWVAKSCIPRLKYAYTVCESLSEIFESRYGTRFEVIRNVPFRAVETAPKTPIKEPKILLYQGALNAGRGIEQMLYAMQGIEGAELWLAGEGDLSQFLRALKADLQLGDKVKFLGYVLPADLKNYTAQAYIGLNLLENLGLNYYYSLANKCFDYIQADVPAIHMDFPEYQKIMKQHQVGLLIPNLEVDNLRAAILTLLENETLYQQLKRNCKAAKEVYIWEKEAAKLLAFYAKITS